MSERISHHAKGCYVSTASATYPYHCGQCQGRDGKPRERRVAKAEHRKSNSGCTCGRNGWNRCIAEPYSVDERRVQRRGVSQGVCGNCGESYSNHFVDVFGGDGGREVFCTKELQRGPRWNQSAPPSSVESAAPPNTLLPEHYHRHPDDTYSVCDCASSPVPKLVEALRQSLDIVHAALQLSGLGEIPANVTRARWLKVYENLNCLVSIEEDKVHSLARDAKGGV